jgi:hypothetical protein
MLAPDTYSSLLPSSVSEEEKIGTDATGKNKLECMLLARLYNLV